MPDDKHRIEPEQAIHGRFRLIGPEETVPFEAVTAVCVIPFTRSGHVVAVVQPRGLDIPGGHVQVHEVSLEQTARRETEEEAAVALEDVVPIGYLESSTPAAIAGRATYIAFATAFVRRLLPFTSVADASQRRILLVEDFLLSYSGGDVDLMSRLVKKAHRALFPRSAESEPRRSP